MIKSALTVVGAALLGGILALVGLVWWHRSPVEGYDDETPGGFV